MAWLAMAKAHDEVFGTTKTYPPDVAPGPWTTAFSKWSSWEAGVNPRRTCLALADETRFR